jgi:hypothetical protein
VSAVHKKPAILLILQTSMFACAPMQMALKLNSFLYHVNRLCENKCYLNCIVMLAEQPSSSSISTTTSSVTSMTSLEQEESKGADSVSDYDDTWDTENWGEMEVNVITFCVCVVA